jgi:soluble lytic murein transglycosylase
VARYGIIACIAAAAVLTAPPVAAGLLTAEDSRLSKFAFQAADADRWSKVRRLAGRIKDPLTVKIFRWLDSSRRGTEASFEEIAAFMAKNPDWPRQSLLQRRAEEAMTAKTPHSAILAWFKARQPVSTDGSVRYGASLLALGNREKARRVLRDVWINGDFGKRQEKNFYRRYRKLLTREDHIARLDRLLWDGRDWPVRRMLWKVNPGYRALAVARLFLRQERGNVDSAIAAVPERLKNDPGLVYERLRWRRRKGRDLSARQLLDEPPEELGRPAAWWAERDFLARRALRRGHISAAYRLAKNHSLVAGAGFAEAEWLAGWIALRFLGDIKTAKDHFLTMFKAVRYPVSRARGAYWLARAAKAMNDAKNADKWYRVAASFPTAYYGQLAASWLGPGHGLAFPSDPISNSAQVEAFESHELTRGIRIMGDLDQKNRIDPFVRALSAVRKVPDWRSLTAALARMQGRPDLAIKVAKASTRDGRDLVETGYPALIPPPLADRSGKPLVEVPLVLATIRQESAFNPLARSPKGARGLMQLMPRTAHRAAGKLKLPYSPRRLTADPDYNMTLGQAHLAYLIELFDGSYIMALAAYNAGPSKVRKWRRRNGDPRDHAVDAIDWIELIPIDETRNYIQRVMESLQIYRHRLADTQMALSLENDLRR